jgi:hypothetical protein
MEELKLHTLRMRRHRSMHSFLLKSTLVSNSALPFWKMLVFEFLLGIWETLLCSMSALQIKIVPLLDVHQLLMLFAGTLTYSEPETFTLIIFIICYNYYYYHHHHRHHYVICLFVYLLFCINVYFLQCMPVICLWLYVVLLHNVITCMYTVLCL